MFMVEVPLPDLVIMPTRAVKFLSTCSFNLHHLHRLPIVLMPCGVPLKTIVLPVGRRQLSKRLRCAGEGGARPFSTPS